MDTEKDIYSVLQGIIQGIFLVIAKALSAMGIPYRWTLKASFFGNIFLNIRHLTTTLKTLKLGKVLGVFLQPKYSKIDLWEKC